MVAHHCRGSGLKFANLDGKKDLHPKANASLSATNALLINENFSWGDIQLGTGKNSFMLWISQRSSSCLLQKAGQEKNLLWHQNWITIALTEEKNMEDKHHCNTSRTRLCSSHLSKNTGKNPNHYWISVWSNMKKPFANENLSFSSLIKLLSLKHCVPAS